MPLPTNPFRRARAQGISGPGRTLGRRWPAVAAAIGLTSSLLVASNPARAVHDVSLPDSGFEIEEDANLVVDDAGSDDWASVTEIRESDEPTGQTDDSYKGGTKEDTECPNETTGSIPNNKSDLLEFLVYEEPGDPGFLNIAWSRVSDPSGTTLMDFEFNQSTTPCPQGPNVVRTEGDLLIEYAIDQGGARADISGRFWDAAAGEWGPPIDLDVPSAACGGDPCAVGTINDTVIDAADSDGLGEKQPRTFGEAQIDLDLIFDDTKCTSFGSAMLKSRSSDSFTSQLKDFITPVPVDLNNCAQVIIRKETQPDGESGSFGFTKSFPTFPATGDTFSLSDGGKQDYGKTVLFGTGYTVTEDSLPTGFDLIDIDCSASTGVSPSIDLANGKVTFDIDSDSDVLDCTYTNRARGTLIVEKVTSDGTGAFDFTSGSLTPNAFTLTTTAEGAAGKDSTTYSNLAPGTYDVDETVPTGWNLASTTCSDGSKVDAIGVSAGETVTCTFTNERERGAIEITKTRKHAAAGSDVDPHAGVSFEIRDGNGVLVDTVVTGTNGKVCTDGLLVSSFDGDYSVTEIVPTGYVADGLTTKSVTVTESTCSGSPAGVSFANTPKTDVTVSVDSQVDGGTSTVIACWTGDDTTGDPTYSVTTDPQPTANGDGSLTVTDLLPTDPAVTLTCKITVDP